MKYTISKLTVVFIVAGSFILGSCSDVLDVRNEGQLSTEAALSDAKAVGVAMNGAYATLQYTLGSGTPAAPTEALAGDINYSGTDYGYLEIWTQNMSLFTPQFRGLWENTYRGTNAINNILSSLPNVADMTDAQKKQTEGECKFLRAVHTFEALRMWGHQYGYKADNSQPGVILRTSPTKGTTGLAIPRATVEQCYTQIINDLKEAETLLGDTKNDGKATKSAAQAILARVYFQKNDFQNAYSYADALIRSGKFSLNANPRDAFYKAYTAESIMQIGIVTQNNTFGSIRGMYQKTAFGEPPFTLSQDFMSFLATIPSTDTRKSAYVKQSGNSGYCAKYDTTISNVNIIRLPELYLIRAEAGVELVKTDAEVLADINILRKRAGAPEDNSSSGKANLLNVIANERRLEL